MTSPHSHLLSPRFMRYASSPSLFAAFAPFCGQFLPSRAVPTSVIRPQHLAPRSQLFNLAPRSLLHAFFKTYRFYTDFCPRARTYPNKTKHLQLPYLGQNIPISYRFYPRHTDFVPIFKHPIGHPMSHRWSMEQGVWTLDLGASLGVGSWPCHLLSIFAIFQMG